MSPVLFFRFLQLAVNGTYGLLNVSEIDDWQQLYDACKRQALTGIGFTAVERLHGLGVECPKELRLRWMSLAMQIEKRNRRMNDACEEVAAMFDRDGFDSCILKGQGNLLSYPEELALRRQSGDIDIWVRKRNGHDNISEVISYVRGHSEPKEGARYCHIDMPIMGDVEIEVHYRIARINSPLRNRRMQRWFEQREDECMKNRTQMGFAAPTASVNVVYQMTHIFTHFFDEGVGLRQLMDYYFTLKRWHNDCMEKKDLQSQGMWTEGLGVQVMSRKEMMHVLRSFGMAKFAAAVMWVLHEVFTMPTHYYICEPDGRRGRQLLGEIMRSGNFGQYDERDKDMKNGGMVRHAVWKLRRVMRLVKSYPEEALCEPLFRVWHFGWRLVHS